MSDSKEKLIRIFRKLDATQQTSLLDYAEYLESKLSNKAADSSLSEVREPVFESASESETVIATLKRMRRVYPMLETGDLFHEASALVSSNLMGGRPRLEVIEEIEQLFEKHYYEYVASNSQ